MQLDLELIISIHFPGIFALDAPDLALPKRLPRVQSAEMYITGNNIILALQALSMAGI